MDAALFREFPDRERFAKMCAASAIRTVSDEAGKVPARAGFRESRDRDDSCFAPRRVGCIITPVAAVARIAHPDAEHHHVAP